MRCRDVSLPRTSSCRARCILGYPSYPNWEANRTTVDSLTSTICPSRLAVINAALS